MVCDMLEASARQRRVMATVNNEDCISWLRLLGGRLGAIEFLMLTQVMLYFLVGLYADFNLSVGDFRSPLRITE